MEIDLTQACVGEVNTIARGDINWPIIYGVGVNIRTGEIFPASFTDKGPDSPLRQARNFTGGQTVMVNIKFIWFYALTKSVKAKQEKYDLKKKKKTNYFSIR